MKSLWQPVSRERRRVTPAWLKRVVGLTDWRPLWMPRYLRDRYPSPIGLSHLHIFSATLSALDSARQKPVYEAVSGHYVAHEIAATFLALIRLGDAMDWRFAAACSPPEFAGWLRETASRVPPRALKKHARGPKKPKQKPAHDPKKPHVSTYQLLKNSSGTP
jgi:hypothetical protein